MKKAKIDQQLRDAFSLPTNATPRVLIWGLGVHGGGEGMLRFFVDLGWDVVVHDPKPRTHFTQVIKEYAHHTRITWVLGSPWKDTLLNSIHLIVKNPGVPLTHPGLLAAHKKTIPVTSDADLFTRLMARERIIGVTGTKGKTTTTMLIAHLLGKRAIAVGTPGRPFLSALSSRATYIIAEFSSFDCDLLSTSPHVAVCTSLFPDHLNRYSSFAHYARSKSRLWKFQKMRDIVIVGDTVPQSLVRGAKGKVVRPTALPKRIQDALSYAVHPESATIAVGVARALGISMATCLQRLESYHGEEGRRERVPTAGPLIAFNDTTATNPGSATHSILSLTKHFPHHLRAAIVGGEDKSFPNSDIREMAQSLSTLTTAYLLPGSFTDRLVTYLGAGTHIVRVPSMHRAVMLAKRDIPEGVILLSPGAASFNLYAHEFERGRDFVKEITRLNHGKSSRRRR